ncbi:MAG TPA: ATP-binding protein [Candidatus Paceibacterota bacterium]|nr:ATP-binding protein [Candidatus Paceibacterota bacterium]
MLASMLFALVVMTVFEWMQHTIRPGITIIESRLYTILFVVAIVGLVAYYIKQRENSFIAERNRAQRVLRENEVRFHKLISHIPGVVFQFRRRPDGTYSVPFTTEGIYEIFGCRPEQVFECYDPIGNVVLPEDYQSLIESFELSAANLSLRQKEFRIKLPGQPIKWLLSHSTPELEEDGGILWHGHVADITKYRMAGEERSKLQKLESLGILAGGIAHDFNNILTAIMAQASMASMTSRDDQQRGSLDAIVKATERATGLTQQLLAFARGGIPCTKTTSVAQVIRESAEFIIGKGSKSVCELELSDDLWLADIDASQIGQVIQNLVLNANQAMPDGGKIRILAKNAVDPEAVQVRGDYIHISVIDKGIGIPDKYIERIFEPYFTTKGERAGSGLGLSVVYRIIEKHHGKIIVNSKEGKGTTFCIYLPALGPDAQPVPERVEKSIVSRPCKILAMDDDRAMQEVLTEALAMLGHKVTVASHGVEAIEIYQSTAFSGEPFDLVILDLTIPGGMGGEETLKRLLEINPELIAIISSGYSDRIPTGFKASLPKPYTIKSLSRVIGEAMASASEKN